MTATLLAGGCGTVPAEPPSTLRAGYDTWDGELAVWPARGTLAGDRAAADAITDVVKEWRSPIGDRVHLPSSGILWLGELDGARTALVAADVPGEAASWLLQLTGRDGRFEINRAAEYPDPGYLVYADVLPVQVGSGRRYLTSARVEELRGPDGEPVPVTDGISAPVDVPRCSAVTVTARIRATGSLPTGKPDDKLLDLGTGVESPRYPLINDESGSGAPALRDLDTCALAGAKGAFGSIPRRVHDRNDPDSVPDSWPMERIRAESLGEVTLADGAPGELQQLSWHTSSGAMTAMVYRPSSGASAVSPADRESPLQTYELPAPGQPVVVLVFDDGPEYSLAVPPGVVRRVDQRGLVVVDRPAKRETYGLAGPDETVYRTVGD